MSSCRGAGVFLNVCVCISLTLYMFANVYLFASKSSCAYILSCIWMLLLNKCLRGCIMNYPCVTNQPLNVHYLHGSTSDWVHVIVQWRFIDLSAFAHTGKDLCETETCTFSTHVLLFFFNLFFFYSGNCFREGEICSRGQNSDQISETVNICCNEKKRINKSN